MADCDISIDSFNRVDGDLDISTKYFKLMQDTLADDSLYTRAKETLFHLFENLQLTEKEKATVISDFMSNLAINMSSATLSTALSWAKEERDGAYTLAKVKTDAEIALATKELVKEQICETQNKTDLICAQIEATIAGSIRENGNVTAYDPSNPCKPKHLDDTGLKHEQTKQVEAATYQIFADAYRKSGVVKVGVDSDQVRKGITGTTHDEAGEIAGYTAQQTANAERQRIAYEDSKRNHAANSSASMIGQLLSAEVAPKESDVDKWRAAVDYLNRSHSSTPA